MLKHVRHAGLSLRVLHSAGVHNGNEGEYRRFRPLAQNKGQTVLEHLDRRPFFKRGHILSQDGPQGKNRDKSKRQDNKIATHFRLPYAWIS